MRWSVFEQTEWADQSRRSDILASHLCVLVPSTLTHNEPAALLKVNSETLGLPGWALDEDGDIALVHALPFADGFPVDWLRKRLLVSIGLAVEALRDVEAIPITAAATLDGL